MSVVQGLRLLVTGTTGQVGWELLRSLAPLGEVIAADRQRMNLSDPDSIRRTIREVRPDVLVNPAAWTAVDRAEAEAESAAAINATAPGVMAEECRLADALLVHFSTDFVFDGSGDLPWSEDDAPGPLNVYGATKLAGETAIRASGARHLVLRTSWVYSLRGNNFLRTMVRLAQRGGTLKVVDDQFGAVVLDRAIDARAARQQTHHRQVGDGLAGAGLADHAEHLTAIDGERHVANGVHDTVFRREANVEIVDFEKRHGSGLDLSLIHISEPTRPY